MTTCNKGSIVDVECFYEYGKFMLSSFDACVPDLFTVRFRAPADYKAGDVIVFRKEELPVRTPGMASATTDIFKTGAIVHADIDLVSRRAFVWMGGTGGALPNLSYEEQFAGFYYLDGKKVYVCTVGPYAVPVNSDYAIDHGIANIDTVVKFDAATRHDHPNAATYEGSAVFGPDHFAAFCAARGNVACVSRGPWNGYNTHFTLYYTCTDR